MEVGFPPGVINVIPGLRPKRRCSLVEPHGRGQDRLHPGETGTGKIVMTAAAQSNLKRVSLELGGKSPNIVLADADMDAAIEGAYFGLFFNQGQCCVAGSRVFVEEAIYDEFLEKMTKKARARKVGDPFLMDTDQGPQVSKEQQDRVRKYIDIGKQEGARLLIGGSGYSRFSRQGLLRRADRVCRCGRRHDDSEGRNLRPGHERAEVQGHRRSHRAW